MSTDGFSFEVLATAGKALTRLAADLNQDESVLARRKLECLSTEFLFCLAGSLRAQIRKQRLIPQFSSHAPEPKTETTV